MDNKITDEVRWGIIGAGDVCEIKSGPALQRAANSKLVAVMRRNTRKAKDFAERHGVPKWHDTADALINDPEVNAIYIATPPNTHMEYTLKAAEAQKPVYVEKPMARSYRECMAMVNACEKAQLPLFVAYYRRALPNILKIKEILDAGLIGEVRFVSIQLQKPLRPDIVGASQDPNNWRVDPKIAGGGYFYDLASHQIDALDFLLGPIVAAHGISKNQSNSYPADDITLGSFRFKNGVLGQGIWAFNVGECSDIECTRIVGSRGQVSFPFFGDHSVSLSIDDRPVQRFTFDISKHIQQPLIQTIVNELLGNGSCPSSGITAARTNWVMEQICQ